MALAGSMLAVACAPEPPAATGVLSEEYFVSARVDEPYLLRIRVPPGYDPSGARRYPLVVQLDPTFAGLEQYAITVGLVSEAAAAGEGPEAIVVGVDYDDPTLRERDYLPPEPPDPTFDGEGADRFYRVLTEELLPELQDRHAIDPQRRYLLGHSNGGIFAWYAALRHGSDAGAPPLAGIVAADNGYPEALFTYERWHAERSEDWPLAVYATRATYNGAGQAVVFDAMIDRIEGRRFPGLRLETEVLETDHGGAVWPSYEGGLRFLLGEAP